MAYSVKVSVRVLGHVIVEDNVNSLDIHPSPKEVCCYQDTLAEILECLVTSQPVQWGAKHTIDDKGTLDDLSIAWFIPPVSAC